ncbi:CheR family methyltransferase [Pseudomonas panipatensis]|uniref:Chemotaxis protein methyltransferase WspC n=1 Tax=Pseudomonas panipatensis TaxID=428992 RepID=A0A1G8DPG1_9PSED|nr:protein-glutamate O-methyltransferase CheR [Pseudomonas panipatensis]SDH59527.1 chemotaxis protein methyltransferase WspC [Pseudomonas panipatensis]SMP40417.1 MCP methyltransferase, CheR-type [Pseudomonas panipatensis]
MIDARFSQLLKERIGLDADSVGAAVVARAVRQCANRVAAGNVEAYWQRLQDSAEDVQALIEAVIVPETWFFRYPESFAALARLASRRQRELAGARPLRILSLPCASGEEPYSIAMTLLDAGLPEQSFQIDALDISPAMLERAQHGQYGRNSFRGSELGFRERYFVAQEHGYLLDERVRRRVRLRIGNLLAPGLLAEEPAYDYLFCRNLLIYFDRATQERAVQVLRRLVRDDGVLFIGPAEASLLSRQGMRPLGVAQSFAFCLEHEPPAAPLATPFKSPRAVVRQAPVRPQPLRSTPRRPAIPAKAPVAGEDSLDAGLAEVARLANQGDSERARQRCESLLVSHGPSAPAYYWLGLLSDAGGQAEQALGFYRKALYLQPDHQESLLHLAALLAARGDAEGARRLQERAARGVKRDV